MESAHVLAARANAAVAGALTLDEQGRRDEAVVSYRWARGLLAKAVAAAPRGSPLAATLGSRAAKVESRLAVLGGGRQRQPSRAPAPPAPPAPRPGAGASDPAMVAAVESEIMDTGPGVSWDDIAGCEDVKEALQELLIRPTQRPDLYNGVRNPAKGLLLAGPPGTGKTLCAKAAATECGSGMGKKVTFFSVSSSTFASKWHGDGEKLMRALFEVARARQPSLLFFDEVDSLLGARGSGEHEASRRLKTEFLVQVDGATGAAGESVFVMGATNRPQDLDDAVLRRLSKRIYVPLPPRAARLSLLEKLTVDAAPPRSSVTWSVTRADLSALAAKMPYFSGADIHALVREASLMPLRELPTAVILSVDAKKVRGVSRQDFETALAQVKPSVSKAQLAALERWDEEFGLGSSARRAARPGEPSPGGGATMSIPRVFQAPSKPLRRKRRPRD